MNARKTNLRYNFFKELKTEYKALFESKLAVSILQNPTSLPAVAKISNIIAKIIEDNIETALELVTENEKIAKELFDIKYFGRIEKDEDITAEIIISKILEILKDKNAALDKTMQVHAIFRYRMLPLLRSLKDDSPKHISERIRKNNKSKLTNNYGISQNKVFKKMVGNGKYAHAQALGMFAIDPASNFFKITENKNIPFVAGPSGHTVSLMSGALIYGITDHEELKQYALAAFAFLTAGGNHSFHEVMIAANTVARVPFEVNNYAINIPNGLQHTDCFQKIAQQFPEYTCPNKDQYKPYR